MDQRSSGQSWAVAGPSNHQRHPQISVPPQDPTAAHHDATSAYVPPSSSYAENSNSQEVALAYVIPQAPNITASCMPIEDDSSQGWPPTIHTPFFALQDPLVACPTSSAQPGEFRKRTSPSVEFGVNNRRPTAFRPHKRMKLHRETPSPGVHVDNSIMQSQAQMAGPSRIRLAPVIAQGNRHQRTQLMSLPLGPHTSSQPLFQPDNMTCMSNGPTNNVNRVGFGNFGTNYGTQIMNTGNVLWDNLPKPQDASGHRSNYLEGSRDEDVGKVRTWVKTPSSELTLWIYGPAGIGKSTLAREVSRDLRGEGLLGAFIPLSSLPNGARGPESVIKMIAREIGEAYPDAIPAITEAISGCKGTGAEDHFWNFVGKPIQALQRSSSIVVALDAFDEWEFSDVLVKALGCLAPFSSMVRFIILGRSDPKSLGHENSFTKPYPLRPVPTAMMEKYFDREFEGVKWDYGRKPSARDVSRLAEQADGLFIWASVVCSLMRKGLGMTSPNETLEGILCSRKKVGETGHLGTLYGGVLQLLFPEEDEQGALRRYLGMILILQEPLPLDVFSSLSSLSSRSVHTIQTRLGALQIRNTTDDRPTVHPAATSFHLSFIEYLQRVSTPGQPAPFAAPSTHAHSELAKACLHVLATDTPLSDFPNLSQKQWYVARHWVTHLSEGAPAVKPGSSSDWEATELCSVLQGISMTSWQWWSNVILELLAPGCAIKVLSGAGASDVLESVVGCLDRDQNGQNPTAVAFGVACLSVVTRLRPDDFSRWARLGEAYVNFAATSWSVDLLHQAVAACENAMAAGGSSDPAALACLGGALQRRFEHLGVMPDLDESISVIRNALSICPSGHWTRQAILLDLANSLSSRFEVTKSFDDLQEAIALQEEALDICPPEDADRFLPLRYLACSLRLRFLHATNALEDLQKAIDLGKEALDPSDHLDHPQSLDNIAFSLHLRFKTTKSFDDLQEAIGLLKEALSLCPSYHPYHPSLLNHLGECLSLRFGFTGFLEDLQEAIGLVRGALALCPSGHPTRREALRKLAGLLISHPGATNSLDDLHEPVGLVREDLALCPSSHPDRQRSLSCLASFLFFRFKVSKSLEDVDEAIVLEKEALALFPSSHPDRPRYLGRLATFLSRRSRVSESLEDLDEAIVLGREALALRPPGHPDRPESLLDLGKCFLVGARTAEDAMEYLDEAIPVYREALVLCPPGHADRRKFIGPLEAILKIRSRMTDSVEDMNEASTLREELDRNPALEMDAS